MAAFAVTLKRLIAGRGGTPAQRMHRLFLFTGALVLLLSALSNGFFEVTSLFFAALLTCVAAVAFGLWWHARQGGNSQRMAVWMGVLVTAVALPLNWFANQGISGPSLILYLIMATYMLSALRLGVRQHYLAAAAFLTLPTLLALIEGWRPSLSNSYASPRLQLIDLLIAYYFCIVVLFVLMAGHRRRLLQEKRRVRRFAARMREQTRRDGLTGLFNHATFHALLARRLERDEERERLALLIYDLDHFKQINDTRGHPYGDAVLRHFSGHLAGLVEKTALAAGRCGGEEFCVLIDSRQMLPETFDRALRERLEQHPMHHGVIAFSGGFDYARPREKGEESAHSLYERADRALYRAKRSGRGCLTGARLFGPAALPPGTSQTEWSSSSAPSGRILSEK